MPKLEDRDFRRLVGFIRNGYGIDLEKKRMLVEGRLSSELRKKGYEDFSAYIDDALADPTGRETARMVNRLTTNHTFFMREPEHFAFMKNVFLPDALAESKFFYFENINAIFTGIATVVLTVILYLSMHEIGENDRKPYKWLNTG